jgi:hypothetical protein
MVKDLDMDWIEKGFEASGVPIGVTEALRPQDALVIDDHDRQARNVCLLHAPRNFLAIFFDDGGDTGRGYWRRHFLRSTGQPAASREESRPKQNE